MWLWLRGEILTNDNLEIRRIPHNEMCNLCDQADETPLHLILQFPFARSVWQLVADSYEFPELVSNAMEAASIKEWWNERTCTLPKKRVAGAIYTAWNIWTERNRRVFQHKFLQEQGVLHLIRQDFDQPTTTMRWLSDVENAPEQEPD